jgi:soluble lytic murein transglycosylase-like protein
MNKHLAIRHVNWSRRVVRIAVGGLAVALVSLPAVATDRASTKQAVSSPDPFAAYNAQLTDAASRTLERIVQPEPVRSAADVLQNAEKQAVPTAPTPTKNSALQRVEKLQPVLEPILREVGVPTALTSVVLVESGGEPMALSPKGARGLWQLMPDTARRYGLRVTPEQDERIDVVKSTRAAAHYLRDLYTQFGNWPLALAAYNVGESAVERMLDRTETKTFFSLSRLRLLPEETRNYVPAVLSSLKLFNSGTGLAPASPLQPSPGGLVLYAESQPGN